MAWMLKLLLLALLLHPLTRAQAQETNLDVTTWLELRASKLIDNQNYNRYAWQKAIQKLAGRETIRILEQGSGLVDLGLLNQVLWRLTNQCPLAGVFTWSYPYLYSSTLGGTAYHARKDTNWYNLYFVLRTSGDSVDLPTGLAWNVVEFDYKAWPGGGTFQILTNNNAGGGYTSVGLDVNTSNNVVGGASVFWTNTLGPQKLGLQVRQSSSFGTNLIVNAGIFNNTVQGGLVYGVIAQPSSWTVTMVSPGEAVLGPIYSNWAPDLILFHDIENARPSFTTNLQTLLNILTNYLPDAFEVLCGTYPVQDAAEILPQNAILRSNAVALGMAYFDGWSPFESVTNVYNLGLASPENDPHYNRSGYAAYGYFLSRWLALGSTPQAIVMDAGLGVQSNRFGFNISWTNGSVIVVEACTNLANPVWTPLQTNALTGDALHFSDPQWTNYAARFYCLRWL